MEITIKELELYEAYLLGKRCPKHPNNVVKRGHYDLWCGMKDELGRWCNGGPISQIFLNNLRRERKEND